ncbi:hypothetical protein ScPMuIL_005300 [Solemya velum]
MKRNLTFTWAESHLHMAESHLHMGGISPSHGGISPSHGRNLTFTWAESHLHMGGISPSHGRNLTFTWAESHLHMVESHLHMGGISPSHGRNLTFTWRNLTFTWAESHIHMAESHLHMGGILTSHGGISPSHGRNLTFTWAESHLHMGGISPSHGRNLTFTWAESHLHMGGISPSHRRNLTFTWAESHLHMAESHLHMAESHLHMGGISPSHGRNLTFTWRNLTFTWRNLTFTWRNLTFTWAESHLHMGGISPSHGGISHSHGRNLTFTWRNLTFTWAESHIHMAESHIHMAESHLHMAESHLHTAESHLHMAESHLHMAESHLHMAESHIHMAESHIHMAESHIHMAESHLHMAESHLHTAESHLHMAESHLHMAESHLHMAESHLHMAESHLHMAESHLHMGGISPSHGGISPSHGRNLTFTWAESHLHMAESHLHMAESHLHMTESHIHMAESHLHMAESHLHMAESHLHMAESHLHMGGISPSHGRNLTFTWAESHLHMGGISPSHGGISPSWNLAFEAFQSTSAGATLAKVKDKDGTAKWHFKGANVNIKTRVCSSSKPSEKNMEEFAEMREIQHENLNTFLGACVEQNSMTFVYNHCSKGTLKEVLESQGTELDNGVKSFLIADLVRGMCFLHASALASHGKLTSSACLVGDNWVLKISDYEHWRDGRVKGKDLANITDEQMHALLWTSPELLRMETIPENGTRVGDVYSFGIILHEVTFVMGVYPDTGLSDLGKLLCEQEPYRPKLTFKNTSVEIGMKELMSMCWAEIPRTRPAFSDIRDYLHQFSLESDTVIMNNMLKKMECYANDLEDLVEARSAELQEEKRKSDMLLLRMLPPSIANRLKKKEGVEPESFDSVSIFFSDIAHFSSLAAGASAMEVIKMLNDLFTMFDQVIDKFDVYKVETIGDSYMVASGVPDRNKDHACQISDMSLHLLEAVSNFRIEHIPNKGISVRVGIHSGPCCAGVVGSTMPRYCLFGDTVNTASRMESCGEAGKIHISMHTRDHLLRRGGYNIIKRGMIDIKVYPYCLHSAFTPAPWPSGNNVRSLTGSYFPCRGLVVKTSAR